MTGAVLVLVFVGLIAVSFWAIIDAALQPEVAYSDAGLSKGWVTGLLVLTCAVGALVYFQFIRPRLRQRGR
jgi:TRAP-type C4-dicarboxylate transport system permease small subunit